MSAAIFGEVKELKGRLEDLEQQAELLRQQRRAALAELSPVRRQTLLRTVEEHDDQGHLGLSATEQAIVATRERLAAVEAQLPSPADVKKAQTRIQALTEAAAAAQARAESLHETMRTALRKLAEVVVAYSAASSSTWAAATEAKTLAREVGLPDPRLVGVVTPPALLRLGFDVGVLLHRAFGQGRPGPVDAQLRAAIDQALGE